jgi:hypothetical protein
MNLKRIECGSLQDIRNDVWRREGTRDCLGQVAAGNVLRHLAHQDKANSRKSRTRLRHSTIECSVRGLYLRRGEGTWGNYLTYCSF